MSVGLARYGRLFGNKYFILSLDSPQWSDANDSPKLKLAFVQVLNNPINIF